MADKPILFSAPMIRALLDGRKTQTRRVIKPQPPDDVVRHCWYDAPIYGFTSDHDVTGDWHKVRLLGYKGDRLWVRERWKPHSLYDHMPPREMPQAKVFYLADKGYSPSGSRGRPGLHMPRWASRLTLIVEDVKVERLQDITFNDLEAEGIVPPGECMSADEALAAWQGLWNDINGPGAWEQNPWVAAYTFRVIKGNIDQIEAGHVS